MTMGKMGRIVGARWEKGYGDEDMKSIIDSVVRTWSHHRDLGSMVEIGIQRPVGGEPARVRVRRWSETGFG